jgi:hypothetical protein
MGTDKPSRRTKYSEWLPELKRIEKEIDTRILPQLEKLFQDDSDEFDRAISLRRQRNKANIETKAIGSVGNRAIETCNINTHSNCQTMY